MFKSLMEFHRCHERFAERVRHSCKYVWQ